MVKTFALIARGSAAVLLVAASSACVSAGYNRYPVSNRRVVGDRAFQSGYDEGRRFGTDDARRGRSFDYGRHREYRSADRGYGGYGSRDAYRDVYRQGFVAGYNDGYRALAPRAQGGPYSSRPDIYDNRRLPSYGSPATQVGYRDGLDQGRRDRNDRRAFDPVRAERYRQGDHDYNGRYGSRDDYKREYRAAFQQGYQEGYR